MFALFDDPGSAGVFAIGTNLPFAGATAHFGLLGPI